MDLQALPAHSSLEDWKFGRQLLLVRKGERTRRQPATEQAQRGTPRLVSLHKIRRNQENSGSIKESQRKSKLLQVILKARGNQCMAAGSEML